MSRYRRSLASGGVFFFTVNLADRKCRLLVDQIDRLRLADAHARDRYPFRTLAYCVLPEHLHVIWQLPADDADFGLRWSTIKRAFSKDLAPGKRSASKIAKREKGIWQRRFWEHQIRDELDLQQHVDYIHFNPVKHGLARCVVDWPYSSFHRYVERGLLTSDWSSGESKNDEGTFGE